MDKSTYLATVQKLLESVPPTVLYNEKVPNTRIAVRQKRKGISLPV